jgi:membrane protein DedA with SNARE-associated domain
VGVDFQLAWDGYLVFFLWILGNRIGVPIPATPALLIAGALSGTGELRLAKVVVLAVVATLLSDSVWFELGRRHGLYVLKLLCRLAIEPDTCQRRAETFMLRHGVRSLLVAKFIPGMNRTMLPLTGMTRCSYPRFLAFDAVGAALWATGYTGLGYIFSEELERAVRYAAHIGWVAGVAAALALLGVYFAVRLVERQRVARLRKLERLSPKELDRRLRAGEEITVIDLRNPFDVNFDPAIIPGARRVAAEDLDQQPIPPDRATVLYCA